jgi:hypothetical protein
MPRGRPLGRRPTGDALARLKTYRVLTLRAEGFTEAEIRVYMDRRISTRGMRLVRRERAREVVGLSAAEIAEWREQMYESYDESYAADTLRRVSPEE